MVKKRKLRVMLIFLAGVLCYFVVSVLLYLCNDNLNIDIRRWISQAVLLAGILAIFYCIILCMKKRR
ncbi:hypothetical protein [Anaerovorax odorimutans]|uniref:hypothetical protein n=1 Tax=Anaerovorax odorimutans TaxID=109327 RepID=UPI000429FD8C|nr:hypothetical protein [Anaerovorax odorimutans]